MAYLGDASPSHEAALLIGDRLLYAWDYQLVDTFQVEIRRKPFHFRLLYPALATFKNLEVQAIRRAIGSLS
jgi:hypothetical protein